MSKSTVFFCVHNGDLEFYEAEGDYSHLNNSSFLFGASIPDHEGADVGKSLDFLLENEEWHPISFTTAIEMVREKHHAVHCSIEY